MLTVFDLTLPGLSHNKEVKEKKGVVFPQNKNFYIDDKLSDDSLCSTVTLCNFTGLI